MRLTTCPQFDHDEHIRAFHQHEWGDPVRDPAILFEYLVLYTFTAALPLDWVLKRREAFRDEGLDRFHDRDELSADIIRLRELHAEMDRAVLEALSTGQQ